ncbi:phytoene desaturase family protein, partial [Microbacterium sp.]|uniref:phytoene desaturase family protein n=1 Tax=Microbacterium sp. TaxID=51671 RepID=UPI0035AF7D4C
MSRTGSDLDAVVVGAGPNGLAAAVTLARSGLRVRVYERADQPGGGAATRELTLPGFRHDVCSAVHPLAFESRFFREFGLRDRVEFVTPDLSYAHPLDGGRAALAYRDLARTREGLGRDGASYERIMRPLVERSTQVADFTGGSLLRIPGDPVTAVSFGLRALEQGGPAWNARFREEAAPALMTGVAAHTILSQPSIAAAGAGLALGAYAHARGWPIPLGGSQAIVDAMGDDLRALGGEVVLEREV